MRNAFADELTKIGAQDERTFLLAGDIGNRLFDDFKARCPDRFINCGVAEANMVGVGAGLALSGMRPVLYTITPFITTRVLEQVRDDVCYQHLPVVLVGVGGGLSYAGLGPTHHSCEDIAFLRALPGMTVTCPGDAHEVRGALRAAIAHDGPVYMRLGKKGEPLIHADVPSFELGRAITVRGGDEVCLLSTGNLLPLAIEVGEALGEEAVSTRVVSFHTVKPLDEEMLAEAFDSYAAVVTLEEHSLIGGLGAAVAEWYVDRGKPGAPLVRIGTADWFLHESGEQGYARERYGLTVDSITERVLGTVRTASPA